MSGRKTFFLIFAVSLWFTMTLFAFSSTNAQTPQCGFADSINYPVDTAVFKLVQDFGVPSGRHQGRYHTGEDWFAGRVENYGAGLHVVAAATGRVTYSSATGWGRDGGVVILEHSFTDGTILYTQYGHMAETDSAKFPTILSCVRAGEIIGSVGNVRPAPHLHFEIRTNNPDFPGPGYSWVNPVEGGWRNPHKFVQNWQAYLQPAHRWHLDLADEAGPAAPPVQLEDDSLIYLDAGRVGRLSPDGRVLWRVNLERPAVSLVDDNGTVLILYADGTLQGINLDGALLPPRPTGVEVDAQLLRLGDTLLVHTPGAMLARFGITTDTAVWRLTDVPPVIRSAAGQVIGLITEDSQLFTLSPTGNLLDRAQLREMGSLAVAADGHLLVYTHSGLWRILPDGTWEIAFENAPPGSLSSALVPAADGILYLFDGRTLHAYNRDFESIWQVDLPGVSGSVELNLYASNLLLSSNHGHIIAVRASDGGLCNRAQIYGSDRAQVWQRLGSDNILRVAVSDQIIGLDWPTFLAGCA